VREQFCNLCQRECKSELLYRVNNYDIVRCCECGLVFVPSEVRSRLNAADVYTAEYFEGGVRDGYAGYRASENTARLQARRALKRIRRYKCSGALLEIGCAYGFFLLEASHTFGVQGVEASDYAAEQARSRGLDVRVGDFFTLSLPDNHFEVVCLFDCIEHLTDPMACLQKINLLLKPGGLAAITTGDIGSLYARISRSRWRLMTPPQHLFFFSVDTLTKLLRKAGFEIREVARPWKLVPWRLALYQLSPRLAAFLGPLGRLNVGIYVNLFDAVSVIAKKS